jgi:CheY-like chemotaxis protein
MGKKILVIDDEPDVVTYLKTLLQKNGYEVLVATDGEEALKVSETDAPDLITLDIMMPKETGVRFYRKLKKEEHLKNIPIIVISGMAGRHLAVPKPEAIFEKPVDREQLIETIRGLIG